MRLINIETLTFKEFFDYRPIELEYAIISHRWTDSEVTYKNFLRCAPEFRKGPGWGKIFHGCRLAREDGLQWLWIDTCCINKDSSAELTEAINSMYNYYGRSKRCYIFLSDVPRVQGGRYEYEDVFKHSGEQRDTSLRHRDPNVFLLSEFRNSAWFTRGWTLQELIAPTGTFEVQFFNQDFDFIGTRSALIDVVSEITGIRKRYLENTSIPLESAMGLPPSIAERMSWAACRETTRAEDRAYCLLGLFDVNMPLLYGEGAIPAFIRLQLELIRKTNDESIFAWSNRESEGFDDQRASFHFWHGLLAATPAVFGTNHTWLAGRATICNGLAFDIRFPYAITNQGLEFTMELPDSPQVPEMLETCRNRNPRILSYHHFILPLSCEYDRENDNHHGGLALQVRVSQFYKEQRMMLCTRGDIVPGKWDKNGWRTAKTHQSEYEHNIYNELNMTSKQTWHLWKLYFRQRGL